MKLVRSRSAALLLAALFFGCGGVPLTYYYRIHSESPAHNNHAPLPAVIGVAPCSADLLYEEDKIVYRNSPYEVQFYHYRRWVAPPKKLVTESLVRRFTESGAFRKVVRFPTSAHVDFILSSRILAFEEWDEAQSWFGLVTLELALLDPESGERIWQQVFTERTPAQRKQPVEVVKAISTSLDRVLDRAIAEISNYLKEYKI